MIQVEEITRNYGDFVAVDKVSFEISRGEIVGFLGHNGAGKTTVMKMLTGFLEPTAGTIRIDGLDIEESRSEVQEKIGYLPENCPVYPEMTVIDYLEFAAELHGVPQSSRLEGGFKVVSSALTVRGRVPGIDADAFRDAAEAAKDGCPISQALKGNVELSIEATLEG